MIGKDAISGSYSHCDQKVGGALFKAAHPGDKERGEVGDEGLYDEDDGNDGEVGQLVGGEL
jgi:hypothetical protein